MRKCIPLIIAFLTNVPTPYGKPDERNTRTEEEFSIMARQFRIGRWNKLTQVVYPQLKPFLYSGLASASGFGWRAIIMGEVLAQCSPGNRRGNETGTSFYSRSRIDRMDDYSNSDQLSFLIEESAGWRSNDSLYITTSIAVNNLCQKEIAIYGFVIFHIGMVRIRSCPTSAILSKKDSYMA